MPPERYAPDDPREWLRQAHVDLGRLLTLSADHGIVVPDAVREADQLSDYAVLTRYPLAGEPVTAEQRREAVEIADAVLHWAEYQITHSPGQSHGH